MLSNEQYRLGDEFERADEFGKPKAWLVVRIVERDSALVVNDAGEEFITTESYVMLKSEDGKIDFIVLLHDDVPSTNTHRIKSLPNLWRRRK